MHSVFAFVEKHLWDHGFFICIHLFSMASKNAILEPCEMYSMIKKKKECLGMNQLHLTSALDNTTTVSIMQYHEESDSILSFIFKFNSYMFLFWMLIDAKGFSHPFCEGFGCKRKIQILFQINRDNEE